MPVDIQTTNAIGPRTELVHARVPIPISRAIIELAEARGTSRQAVVIAALAEHIARHADELAGARSPDSTRRPG